MSKSLINKITSKLSVVEKSRVDPEDSSVRQFLQECGIYEEDPIIQTRYFECANCPLLKEEFKLLGKTIKDMTTTCGSCCCNLNLKIPLYNMDFPEGKW